MIAIMTRSLLGSFLINGNSKIFSNYSKVNYGQSAELRPTKSKSLFKETSNYTNSKIIRAVGGKGGNGCMSFFKRYSYERPIADGGNGGNGGRVIIESSHCVRNLNHITKHLRGHCGHAGMRNNISGRRAKDMKIMVPVGTIIRDFDGNIVVDLKRAGTMFVAAHGGTGGKGSRYFASSNKKADKLNDYGPQVEEFIYKLEMRGIAEVGLIGLPDSGKSTLLNAISSEKPNIVPYPFTKIRPRVGVVQFDDNEQVVVADFPSLTEGSHENSELSASFLNHVERCGILTFVLDASKEKPWEDYDLLENEVKQLSESLLKRPKIIVANKIDEPMAKTNFTKLQEQFRNEVIPISSKSGTNLTKLVRKMNECLNR